MLIYTLHNPQNLVTNTEKCMMRFKLWFPHFIEKPLQKRKGSETSLIKNKKEQFVPQTDIRRTRLRD